MIYPKFTVCGDFDVGKNLLLYSYATQSTEHVYVPEVFDKNYKNLLLNGIDYKIFLNCICGQEDKEKLLNITLHGTHCFILCYSINDEISYKNVEIKWLPIIKQAVKNPLIILVATKCDLRNNQEKFLSEEDGEKMKNLIGAKKYMECSAKNLQSLNEIFAEALKLHVEFNVGTVSEKHKGQCSIL